MSASISIKEGNGAGPVWTAKTAIRFCTSDTHEPGTDHPVSIPSTGFRYSYWKTLCLEISGAFTKVNNVQLFCDGSVGWDFGTGGGLFVGTKDDGDSGLAIGSYDQAEGQEGVTGYAMGDADDGHAVYKGAGYTVNNIEDYVSGATLLVDSSDHTVAEKTKAVVLQVKVDTATNGADAGTQTAETISWRYDEI